MNPFIKHKILKDLPYELMVNPDKDAIRLFVIKKRQRHLWLHSVYAGFGVFMLILNLVLLKFEPVNILNMLVAAGIALQGFWGVFQAKKMLVSQGELDDLLEAFGDRQEARHH
ncbi:MAG: hypothetical protein K9M55_04850 [Candidatus Marinimicrobia bacterium]|nr:hypothetical protein [Candidatus Neomarinimicrobiota bacterium]MCF7922011.1 hypothetical protein [Candidatus Neomarinimicrobiota bacterium]